MQRVVEDLISLSRIEAEKFTTPTEAVDLEQWCEYLGGLVGREATFVETDATIGGVTIDTTKMVELVGGTEVSWQSPVDVLQVVRVEPCTPKTCVLLLLQPYDDNGTREVAPVSRS